MFRKLFETRRDFALTALRLSLGIMIFAHGAQKALGWWGGRGFTATMDGFTNNMGIPAPFALLAIAAEFLGGLGLIFGLLGRVAAFGVGVNMVVAALLVHVKNGFFLNAPGQQGAGFEMQLLMVGMCILLMAQGSGALSLDRMIARSKRHMPNAWSLHERRVA